MDLDSSIPAVDPETVADPATLASLSPPIKPAFRYTYDSISRPLSVSDERGDAPQTTSYAYTEENGGEVVTVTQPGNIVSITKRNPNGTIRENVDANGKSTTFVYYPDTPENRTAGIVGLLQTTTGPDGVSISVVSYDRSGNPLEIRVKDTNNRETRTVQEFDALNRLRKVTRFAEGLLDTITTLSYDLNGNLVSHIDPELNETKYEYNYNHQITKITTGTGPKKADTILSYGPTACPSCGSSVDKLTAVTDAKQQTTNFQYDTAGRLEYEIDPLGKKVRYIYYDNGLVKEKRDATNAAAEKVLIKYTYNDNGRLLKKLYSDGSSANFTYYPDGRLQTASNKDASYSFSYYTNGRLKTVDDNQNFIIHDEYDGLGQRKKVTIKAYNGAQRVITYDYDSANRPWHIYSPSGTFTYNYDQLGRRSSLTYPNALVADYGYDDLNRLTSLTHSQTGTPFLVYGYTHDQAGNRKTRTGTDPANYLYDEVYRLLRAITTRGTENYTYDQVGNRSRGPGPKDTGYQYDIANRMTSGRLMGYGYDNMGNQTTRTIPNAVDKSWTLTWDDENQLVKMEKSKGITEKRTVTFKYDAFGRRTEKKVVILISGTTKTTIHSYFYDGDNIAIENYVGDTVSKTFYTHGPNTDEHLAMERDSQFYFFHTDGLDSVTAITNAAKQIVQSYTYEAFGALKPSTSFRNSYTYTGREWDKETGLYYYRYRYYDPMDGRFISRDPIGFRGGINLFSYVFNNPIRYKDPFGLDPRWPNSNRTNPVTQCHVTPHNDPKENACGAFCILLIPAAPIIADMMPAIMTAAGTPQGQNILNNAPDFIDAIMPGDNPPPQTIPGYLGWATGQVIQQVNK